ncbi:MAG: DUF2125 domain-containing protein [Pseudomonadota bacterium]|nr:DUF2125 domain-containing protein [Pseudomonadota bacterium]
MKWRHPGIICVIAFVIVTGLYVSGWFMFAYFLKGQLTDWSAELRAKGWALTYKEVKIRGFPLSWQVTIGQPKLSQRQKDFKIYWTGSNLILDYRLWNLNKIKFFSDKTHLNSWSSSSLKKPFKMDMSEVQGEINFSAQGELRKFLMTTRLMEVETQSSTKFQLSNLITTVNGSQFAIPNTEVHQKPFLNLDIKLSNLNLHKTENFKISREISEIFVKGTILGKIPNFLTQKSFFEWAKNGGSVEVEKLGLKWSELRLIGSGTLALDPTFQPIGAFTTRITGYNAIIKKLVKQGVIRPRTALLSQLVLNSLSTNSLENGRKELNAPITIQEGWVFVGPLKLFKIPKIKWY